jgi:hypothetical protein
MRPFTQVLNVSEKGLAVWREAASSTSATGIGATYLERPVRSTLQLQLGLEVEAIIAPE